MGSFIWIAVMVVVLAVVAGVAGILAWKGRMEQKATDYKAFFIMG